MSAVQRLLAPVLLLAAAACGEAEASRAADATAVPPRPTETLTVAAAASLRDLLAATATDFATAHGVMPSFSFEASSTLSRQIEEGGDFDAFLSADAANLDRLGDKLDAATRRVFLGNTLAMVGRKDLASPPADPAALAAGSWSIALAGPAVPAGKYARSYLEKKGLLTGLQPRITHADDVRAALALVEAGTVDTAFVYLTDARLARDSKLLWQAPPADDAGIQYVAAAVHGGHDVGHAYVEWLGSDVFLKRAAALGFLRPNP
ncbi:MAG TPA: molybdate ABC transporter substrate-binding protein [Planctomycetota bacterium]|nr:molybdate ABC transporter substrate-binding protein [Planctomycetota bacterium]